MISYTGARALGLIINTFFKRNKPRDWLCIHFKKKYEDKWREKFDKLKSNAGIIAFL